MENIKLSDKAKELRAEYMREYRKRPENKKKQSEYQAKYWNLRAEKEDIK